MIAKLAGVVVWIGACGGAAVPVREPLAATPAMAPAATAPEDAAPGAMPPVTTKRSEQGVCDPVPKEGTPCAEGDSWCVLDWGSPGGASSALWCRGGHWVLELESNE